MRFVIPLVVAALAAASTAQAAVRVPVNQAMRVSLRGQAADVIVGNPAIADVNVLDGRTVYLVGKQTGVTNLVILDGAGRTLFSDTVVVGNATGAGGSDTVTIARGRTMQDVSCTPVCASVTASSTDSASMPPPPPPAAISQAAAPAVPASTGGPTPASSTAQ